MLHVNLNTILDPIRDLHLENYLVTPNKLFKWPKDKHDFLATEKKQLHGIKKAKRFYYYRIFNAYLFYFLIVLLSALIIAVIVTSVTYKKQASYNLAYSIIFFLIVLFIELIVYFVLLLSYKRILKVDKTVSELLVLAQWFDPQKVLNFPYAVAIVFCQAYKNEYHPDFDVNDLKILEQDIHLKRWYKSRQRDLLLHLQRLYFLYTALKYLIKKGYTNNKDIKIM